MKKRIVLAEDHTIVREGLRSLFAVNNNLDIIAEAEDGMEALRYVLELIPDLLLIDLSLPKLSGLDVIKEIRREDVKTKILVLTVHISDEYIHAAFDAGADGYMTKESTYTELQLAIKSVLDGKIYLSPRISATVLEGYLEKKHADDAVTEIDMLTLREREVLKLIAEGSKNKDIAGIFSISVKTVEKHRSNLMKKLGLHNTSALISYAVKKGIISID